MALRGPQSGVLRALVTQQSHFARIAGSLAYLHSHFAEPLNVETLARQANMSASTFMSISSAAPCCRRCNTSSAYASLRAQHLLIVEGLGVAQVAQRVGYQSTSQFSCEYKRYFQRNPVEEGIRAAVFLADSKKGSRRSLSCSAQLKPCRVALTYSGTLARRRLPVRPR